MGLGSRAMRLNDRDGLRDQGKRYEASLLFLIVIFAWSHVILEISQKAKHPAFLAGNRMYAAHLQFRTEHSINVSRRTVKPKNGFALAR